MSVDNTTAGEPAFVVPKDIPMPAVIDRMQQQIASLSYEVTIRDVRIQQLEAIIVENGGVIA